MKVKSTALYPMREDLLLKGSQDRVRVFKHTVFVLQHLIETIEAFVFEHAYYKFDAHVGEALCQIRAYAMMMLKSDFDPELSEDALTERHGSLITQLTHSNGELKRELEESSDLYLIKQKKKKNNFVSVEKLLVDSSLFLEFEANLVFILQLYILTKYRKFGHEKRKSYVDVKEMSDKTGMSRSQVEKLIKVFQRNISLISTDFMIALSADLAFSFNYTEVFKTMCLRGERDLFLSPFYEGTMLVLNHLALQNFIVLFKIQRMVMEGEVDEVNFAYHLTLKDGRAEYSLREPESLGRSMPCFCIYGRVAYSSIEELEAETKDRYIERFNEIGPIDVITHGAALHPQYVGKKLAAYAENSYDLLKADGVSLDTVQQQYLKTAEEKYFEWRSGADSAGCSEKNPSLMVVYHVYCDTPLHHFGEDAFKVDEKPKTRARGNTVRFEVPEESRKLQQASSSARKRSHTVGSRELLSQHDYRQNPPSLFFHSISAEVVKGKSVVAARAVGQDGAPVGRWSCV